VNAKMVVMTTNTQAGKEKALDVDATKKKWEPGREP
jgi:hypothetical protein